VRHQATKAENVDRSSSLDVMKSNYAEARATCDVFSRNSTSSANIISTLASLACLSLAIYRSLNILRKIFPLALLEWPRPMSRHLFTISTWPPFFPTISSPSRRHHLSHCQVPLPHAKRPRDLRLLSLILHFNDPNF
jgi:hypothetical protein